MQRVQAKEELSKLGPMSTDEKITAFAFAITVGLWIVGGNFGINAVAGEEGHGGQGGEGRGGEGGGARPLARDDAPPPPPPPTPTHTLCTLQPPSPACPSCWSREWCPGSSACPTTRPGTRSLGLPRSSPWPPTSTSLASSPGSLTRQGGGGVDACVCVCVCPPALPPAHTHASPPPPLLLRWWASSAGWAWAGRRPLASSSPSTSTRTISSPRVSQQRMCVCCVCRRHPLHLLPLLLRLG